MYLLGLIKKKEDVFLREGACQAAAYYEDGFSCDMQWLETKESYESVLSENGTADMFCIPIDCKADVDICTRSRRLSDKALMLIVADPALPPTLYMRPDVLASQLLLRPISLVDAKQAFLDLYKHYTRMLHMQNGLFIIHRKDGVLRIPYDNISYFESREKKIFACTPQKQIAFYGTLDQMERSLPKAFVRCHKSFIVNWNRIGRIAPAENLIYVPGGAVPISRSYKAAICKREKM